jgi:hypothetical protein
LIVQSSVRLFGIAVAPNDVRTLIAVLVADGRPRAVAAAARISDGLERGVALVALEPRERDAILAALDDPTDGLVELHDALVRDHDRRNAQPL